MNLVSKLVEGSTQRANKVTPRTRRRVTSLGVMIPIILCATVVRGQEQAADTAVKANTTASSSNGSSVALAGVWTIAPNLAVLIESLASFPETRRGIESFEQGRKQLHSATSLLGEVKRVANAQLSRHFVYRQLSDFLTWLADDSDNQLQIVGDRIPIIRFLAER